MTRATFTALGKLRSEREFLRVHASDPGLLAFDEWLVDNMDWASRSAGHEWPSAYANGSVHAFFFRVATAPKAPPALIAGALAPSADAAGRDFPFSVLTRVQEAEAFARHPETLPLLLEELWQSTCECVVNVTENSTGEGTTTTGAQLAKQLERVYVPDAPGARESEGAYREWTDSLPLSDLCALLYGEGEAGAYRLQAALRFIVDLARPHRGVENPKTPLTLCCPLGEAGGAAVCFWIDLVRRAARWKATLPSFFWSHDGGTGSLMLHLGDPPDQTLSELWMPRGARDEFCDLTQDIAPARTALLTPLARDVEALAAAYGRPLSEFLHVFEATLT